METRLSTTEAQADEDPAERARRGWNVLRRYGFGEWGDVMLTSPEGPGHDGQVRVVSLSTALEECGGFVNGLEAVHNLAATGASTPEQAQQILHETISGYLASVPESAG